MSATTLDNIHKLIEAISFSDPERFKSLVQKDAVRSSLLDYLNMTLGAPSCLDTISTRTLIDEIADRSEAVLLAYSSKDEETTQFVAGDVHFVLGLREMLDPAQIKMMCLGMYEEAEEDEEDEEAF